MFLLWNVLGGNERCVIPHFSALGISRQFFRSVAEASPSSLEHCAHTGGQSSPAPPCRGTAQLGLLTQSEEPNPKPAERRKRFALLTWHESEPSLCDLSVQPAKELNKQPRELTPKHLSLRAQLLQWGQECQPTNPEGTTHGTGLVQLLGTLRCWTSAAEPWVSLGSADWQSPQSCTSPESYWLVYLPQPLYSVDFLSQHLQSHRKWFWW